MAADKKSISDLLDDHPGAAILDADLASATPNEIRQSVNQIEWTAEKLQHLYGQLRGTASEHDSLSNHLNGIIQSEAELRFRKSELEVLHRVLLEQLADIDQLQENHQVVAHPGPEWAFN